MKKYIAIFITFISINTFAQIDLAAGMGIGFMNNSSVSDYVNGVLGLEDLGTFSSSFEAYVEGDYSLNESFQLGLEYVYTIFSHTNSLGVIQYDFSYDHHKPSLLAYYVIAGEGYKFKFGGGAGPRFVNLDEKFQTTTNYTSTGFGVLGRIQAHTKLSDDFYANIGSTVRYDVGGEPKSSQGKYIGENTNYGNVSVNSLSFSINIGVSYFIGN
jgi:hypothetical protein